MPELLLKSSNSGILFYLETISGAFSNNFSKEGISISGKVEVRRISSVACLYMASKDVNGSY